MKLFSFSTLCMLLSVPTTLPHQSAPSRARHIGNGIASTAVAATSALIAWKTLTFKLDRANHQYIWMFPHKAQGYIAGYLLKDIYVECYNNGGTPDALYNSNRLDGDILFLLGFVGLITTSSRRAYTSGVAARESFKKAWFFKESKKDSSSQKDSSKETTLETADEQAEPPL